MSLSSDMRDYNAPSWSPKTRPDHHDLCVLCCVVSRKQYPRWCSSLKLFFIMSEPKSWHLGLISPSSVTVFHALLPVLPKLGPQISPLWWCTLFHKPPAMLLACCVPATVFWDGAGDVLPCVIYPALPAWCDGRNAHLSLCTGSSERIPRCQLNRQRLKSHYHSSSSWFCRVLATSWESIIFCIPLKNFPRLGELSCFTCCYNSDYLWVDVIKRPKGICPE